jgi:hypothetical protein
MNLDGQATSLIDRDTEEHWLNGTLFHSSATGLIDCLTLLSICNLVNLRDSRLLYGYDEQN